VRAIADTFPLHERARNAHEHRAEQVLHVGASNDVTREEFMPGKAKNALRNKTPKSQRRVPVPAPRTNVDVHATANAPVARREPVVSMSRKDAQRSRGMDAMERAIAKEDAKIIAKASARAIRRGLH
jgi:hypothetical protein